MEIVVRTAEGFVRQIQETFEGLVPRTTKIHNNSGIPIFLIPINWVDGPDPQSHSVVRKDLVKEIPAGGFNSVDSHEYDPDGNTPASQIRILFRAGHTNNDEEFLGNLKAELEEELYSPHYLFKKGDRYFSCNKAGQVIEVDKNSLPISGMEFFRNAQVVRLRNCHDQFLVAKEDQETVALSKKVTNVFKDMKEKRYASLLIEREILSQGDKPASVQVLAEIDEELRHLPRPIDDGWWFVVKSDSVLHLKSCHDKYLTAFELPSLAGMTDRKVLQSLPPLPDSAHELEPVKAGNRVKLRTHYGTFLCSHPQSPDSVTHDLSPSTAILWDVDVVKRVEEGTATNIDDKASEEGSTSNIDDKASSATERGHVTGEGSSVTKSPSGDSGHQKIPIAGDRPPPGMELFHNAKTVRLWSQDGRYLVAEGDEVIALRDEETRQRDRARWSVEFVDNSNSILRLKSCHGKYLTASDQPFLSSMTSRKVLQSLPSLPDSSLGLEPVMEGTQVKLRTHDKTFLCANGDSITHGLPHLTAILWDVEVVERELSRALELKDENVQSIPEDWLNQTDAVALILKNSSIEVIPDSIGKLEHLEILNAKHSLVTELPPDVAKLDKMRDILIYHYEKGPLIESPDLIGFKASCSSLKGFKCLEKLCFMESDKKLLNDLGNLTELRRLGITKFRKDHGESLCTSLGKLKKIKSLNIHAIDQVEILDLHCQTSPPKSLRHLYLHGRLEKLPDWISSHSLQYLTKLILRWSHLEGDLLKTLGELPKLVELQLHRAYDGEQLNFENKQFLKLKILLLHELEGLRSMSLEHGTLPSLEILTISRCQWLEEIPSGIKHIHAKKLTLSDMSNEFYEKAKADHGKDNYQIFEHIDEVYFARWKAGYWETHTSSQMKAFSLPKKKDMKASQVN